MVDSTNNALREVDGGCLAAEIRSTDPVLAQNLINGCSETALLREDLGGLYVAFEHYIPIGDDPHAVAISTGVNTRGLSVIGATSSK